MRSTKTYTRVCLLAALAVSVTGVASPVKAADKLPGSRLFDYLVGRAIVTSSGDLEAIGYYAFLEGIPGPFFSGDPGEATAFFTFRTGPLVFSNVFVNGSLAWALADPSNLTVYFNTTPQGDWNNPDSFSSGQPIANFKRPEALFTCSGDLTLLNTCSFAVSQALVSSEDFTFNGGTFNFRKLVPDGVTLITPMLDTSFPGFAAVFVGYDLATKR